jgi:hypothetical protein
MSLPYKMIRVLKFGEDRGLVLAAFLERRDAELFAQERTANEPSNRYEYIIVEDEDIPPDIDNK